MATRVDNPSTRRLTGTTRERSAVSAEPQAAQRTRRQRIVALAITVLIAGLVGVGIYAIVHQHASAAATQTPVTQTQPSAVPAATIRPSKPNPEIPSGNNTGNMGTGGGPTHVNPQIPSGNNTGNMGTGGGPVR